MLAAAPTFRHQPRLRSAGTSAAAPAPTLIVLTSLFSESRRALRFAAELAAPLVLLHLDPVAALDADEPIEVAPAAKRELRRDLQLLLHELGCAATIELGTGMLRKVLADAARRYAPALFVLGRPATDEADFDLGLAVEDELRATHLPLLLVPEVYAGPDQPQHLAIAADDEPFALHAGARAARALLAHLPLQDVTVVTASPLQDDAVCVTALHVVRASGLLPDNAPAPTVEGVYATQTEQGLLHALAITQADWLVVLVRPRRFLDQLLHHSVTRRLLRWSPVPVLVVPTQVARTRVSRQPAKMENNCLI